MFNENFYREKPDNIEEEVIEMEEKIEMFVHMNKQEAKFNTEIPFMELVRMPLTGILDLVTNIFKRDN